VELLSVHRLLITRKATANVNSTIKLLFHGERLPEESWGSVLLEALHAFCSLMCLATNETPDERLLRLSRKAMFGPALPSWLLSPGTVLLRRFVRNKGEPLCDPV